MTEAEALQFLNLNEIPKFKPDLEDHVEDLIFKIKTEVIRGKLLNVLLQSRIKRLDKIYDAALKLNLEFQEAALPSTHEFFENHRLETFSDLIKFKEKTESQINLHLSNSLHPKALVFWIQEKMQLQDFFEKTLLESFHTHAFKDFLNKLRLEVKKTALADTVDIMKSLRFLSMQNHPLHDQSNNFNTWSENAQHEKVLTLSSELKRLSLI